VGKNVKWASANLCSTIGPTDKIAGTYRFRGPWRAVGDRSPGLCPHHQLRATEIDFLWCLVDRGAKAELGCSGAGRTHGSVASFAGAASTPSVVGHLHASRSCRDSEVGATDADQATGAAALRIIVIAYIRDRAILSLK